MTNAPTLVDGAIYSIAFNGTDAAGNAATAVTVTGVTFDTTAPTAAITYSTTSPYNNTETVTITATFNEAMAELPVVKIALSGAETLAATAMTKVSTTEYRYSYAVPDANGTQTVALSVGTDVAGNAITSAPTSGADFVIDSTAPSAFDVGTVITSGGTVVAGKLNGTNTTVTVTVPIADDATLNGGTVQLQAKVGEGAYINLGGKYD